jgi:hypothetical protein
MRGGGRPNLTGISALRRGIFFYRGGDGRQPMSRMTRGELDPAEGHFPPEVECRMSRDEEQFRALDRSRRARAHCS